MEPSEELSDFDKGQVVVAREVGLSVSDTARLVGCSRAAVVRAYRQWCQEGRRLRAGRPRTIDPRGLEDESGSDSDKAEGGGAAEENGPEEETEPGGPDATSATSGPGN